MTIKKLAKWTVTALTAVLAGAVVATAARQDRRFVAPTPDIHASADPAVIARGEALVHGPAHCTDCHGAKLEGGREFHLPVGTFRVPNISSGPMGVAKYRDEDLARILRYGVRPDGTAVLPFMPFADLTDEDLTAVVSYLRSSSESPNVVRAHDVNAVGKIVKAWVLTPKGPSAPPQRSIPRAPTVEYGRYLAHSVANCVGCHTKLDMRTGAFAGPLFGGGAVHAAEGEPGKSYVAPNLTPHATSGWISTWSEDVFVARLKSGRVHASSPMPWESFARMTEDDTRALYRYLKTVPAAAGGPDPEQRTSVIMTASK